MHNPVLEQSLTRVITAVKPQKDVIATFVTTKTNLNGRPFTTKNHEYQDILMQELTNPDIQFVLHKIAQAGASEIIYRILLGYCATIPGFTTALVLPSLVQTSEVIKLRIAGIISESAALTALKDSKVDSSSVKRFTNGSIVYGLSGSGTSKSTTISRPIRCIVADELQYINMRTLSSMAARQRHQEHKSTIYFSSPRFKDSDIDAEIQICGHVWQAILKCNRCNHEFFPSFYDNVKLPGFPDPIRTIDVRKISNQDLNIDNAYLECPKCERAIPFGHPHTNWVNVAENPNLPKRGMRIGPFDLPKFVKPADLIRDMVRMDDRNEFDCQFLAIPISARDNALDVTQIKFENHEPGTLNVFGLDIGKMSCLTIGSMTEGQLYIHTIEFLPLKNIRNDLPQLLQQFRCVAGVIDLMPFTELTAHFINTIPNTWAAVYSNSPASAQRLELFTLKNKSDEAIGDIRVININMTPAFDFFADQTMNGLITYKSSSMDKVVLDQLSVMSRQRDYRGGRIDDNAEIVYRWRKPQKRGAEDHIHHSSLYAMLASKLLSKSKFQSGISPTSLIRSFRMKKDI